MRTAWLDLSLYAERTKTDPDINAFEGIEVDLHELSETDIQDFADRIRAKTVKFLVEARHAAKRS